MNKLIKTNKFIFTVGILLLMYGLIEIYDCFALLLLTFKVIKNPYPAFMFEPINQAIVQYPIALFGIFLFFTILRILSAIGLLANRMWGFWLTIFITISTTVNLFLVLPLSALDGVLNIFIISFLLIGYFEKKTIINFSGRSK